MKAEEALARILASLKAERRERYGRLGEQERCLSKRRGYLSQALRSPRGITLKVLLKALEALGVDLARFFGRVFDISPDAAEYLRELEGAGEPEPALARLEKAALALFRARASGTCQKKAAGKLVDPQELLTSIERCPRLERRRWLRTTKKYRHPEFARAYLDRLDALRYENAMDAAKLAEVVALDLVPQLACGARERLALQLNAVGVFASARRVQGRYETAARAIRFALRLAREADLQDCAASLLTRGAYVLHDHGFYDRALLLLGECLAIHSDLGARTNVAKTMVDRGIMLDMTGEHFRATQAFSQAIGLLDNADDAVHKYRLAAHHGLVVAYQKMGNLQRAVAALAETIDIAQKEGATVTGKLLWRQASILADMENYPAARTALTQARKALASAGNHLEEALVCLDLVSVLLVHGKPREACRVAREMSSFLTGSRKNKVLEAALLEFVSASLRGQIEQSMIEKLGEELKKGAHTALSAPVNL